MMGMLNDQSCVICYFCKWIIKNANYDPFTEILRPLFACKFPGKITANPILIWKWNMLQFRIKECIYIGKGF
jgi:hypothetical protein